MNCLEAQSHITAFVNDQLDMAMMEQFINHVNGCPDCREELEVYYTLLTAMKLLDEDKELSNQFSQELDNKIKSSADKIKRKKKARIRKRFYLFALAFGFVIVTSLSVTNQIIPKKIPEKPSFQLNYRGLPKKYSPVEQMKAMYRNQALEYTSRRRQLKKSIYFISNKNRMNPVLLFEAGKELILSYEDIELIKESAGRTD